MSTKSFKEVAEEILAKADTDLSAAEIVERALELDILDFIGKTPVATMGARIYTDIKNNPQSNFIKVGKGRFKLRQSTKSDSNPEEIIEKHNNKVIAEFTKKLQSFDPFLFEQLIGDLLSRIGYEDVQVTKRSADGGIDVIANLRAHGLTNVKTVVQVKRYKNNIQDKVVRELRGSAEVDQRGLIITTSDFTAPAIKEASASNKMPVSLVNGKRLVELLLEYQVGVSREQREVISIDKEYFSTIESNDAVGSSSNKLLSIWPLPGGISYYYESLLEILNQLKQNNGKDQIFAWFKKHFDNVESDRTINGYMGVLRGFGLCCTKDKQFELTDIAKELLKNPSKERLFEIVQERIFGIDEILEYVAQSEQPVSSKDVMDYLNNSYEINWKSPAQTNFRLLWLWNLEKIERLDTGDWGANTK